MRDFLVALTAILAVVRPAAADQWPQWRGPQGLGLCSETALPVEWGKSSNVVWKAALPERGNSTPVVWEDRLFLTQAIEAEHRRTVMCFDRRDGKLVWQAGVVYADKEPTHATNPYCSASPVTDGHRLVASFGSAGLFCYDPNGRELWHRDLGKQVHIWGNASSPILYENLVLFNFGPGERTFLIALDKETGETVWQVDEPGGNAGAKASEWVGSWSTPVIIRVGDHDELVLSWPKRVAAYDPKTGRERWSCGGLGNLVYTSPIYGDGVVVAMSGYGGPALAVRAGGEGDVTETHRLWHTPHAQQRIGSGVVSAGHIYMADEPGIARCLKLETGEGVWEHRLEGPSRTHTTWSSMVLCGDKLYLPNQAGETFVLRAGPAFELIATNSVEEPMLASPAVSNGRIFLRTHASLWCIGRGE